MTQSATQPAVPTFHEIGVNQCRAVEATVAAQTEIARYAYAVPAREKTWRTLGPPVVRVIGAVALGIIAAIKLDGWMFVAALTTLAGLAARGTAIRSPAGAKKPSTQ